MLNLKYFLDFELAPMIIITNKGRNINEEKVECFLQGNAVKYIGINWTKEYRCEVTEYG